MAKGLKDLTVEIAAKLSVDRKTAEACLKMVEIYINANSDRGLGVTVENGTMELNIVDLKPKRENRFGEIDFDYEAEN